MEETKVTIIVPVYNVRQYLNKCLESIISQTYENTEIIIIDDCSTDGSSDICDEYKVNYPNIKVIHNSKNEGVSYSRNKGIELSTGEYILFVDSDDYIETDLIEKATKELRDECMRHTVDTVCFGFKTIDERQNILSKEEAILWPEKYINKTGIFDGYIDSLVVSKKDVEYWFSHQEKSYYETIHKYKKMGSCWRFLLSKEVIIRNNILFKENISRGEDIIFMITYLLFSNGIVNISEYLYNYVQRNTSSMHTYVNIQKKIDLIEEMEQVVAYAPNGKEEMLRDKWRGQRLLSAMNSARYYARECGFIKGFLYFRKFANHKINIDAYNSIKIKEANIKYKTAVGMMKLHLFFLFYMSICLTLLLKKDMAPME